MNHPVPGKESHGSHEMGLGHFELLMAGTLVAALLVMFWRRRVLSRM